ncbi:unnamed protein product, partial [Heterosigma akashiwo]
MWFHVVGMYLLTAITMWQLVVEFRTYTRLRHEFLRRRRALFRSVLVEEVPRPLRSQATLRAYFEKLYPGQVVEVFLCQRLEALTRLIEQRESVLAKLEHAMVHQQRFGKTTYVWRGWGHKEEAVTYWQARPTAELSDEVSASRRAAAVRAPGQPAARGRGGRADGGHAAPAALRPAPRGRLRGPHRRRPRLRDFRGRRLLPDGRLREHGPEQRQRAAQAPGGRRRRGAGAPEAVAGARRAGPRCG